MKTDRRRRAIAFAAAAALCAGLAATAVGDQSSDITAELGVLREVVVARTPVRAQHRLTRRDVDRRLDVRRVPERFVPPGALTSPRQAVGRVTATSIQPGGYVLAAQLELPGESTSRDAPRLGGGRHPVEIAVSAAGALAAGPAGRTVDVVVTTEPGPGGGAGRTYVAAEAVQLLELRSSGAEAPADALPGPGAEQWIATLALRRRDALRLIQAESFARSVRLIPR